MSLCLSPRYHVIFVEINVFLSYLILSYNSNKLWTILDYITFSRWPPHTCLTSGLYLKVNFYGHLTLSTVNLRTSLSRSSATLLTLNTAAVKLTQTPEMMSSQSPHHVIWNSCSDIDVEYPQIRPILSVKYTRRNN